MIQDKTTMDKQQRLFVERVVDSGKVWSLSRADSWAVSLSHDYEDTEVIPFWSDQDGARAGAVAAWAKYKPQQLSLIEFLEDWLPGMHHDTTLAGINWDARLSGNEVEPLPLALELIAHIKYTHTRVVFRNYSSLIDFETQIRQELAD